MTLANVPEVDGLKKYHKKKKSEVTSAAMYPKKYKEKRNLLDLLRK